MLGLALLIDFTLSPESYQWHNMVNVHIRWVRPSFAIVVTKLVSRSRRTIALSLNIGSVSLEHVFASIATPTDGDPGVEVVSVVWRTVYFIGDCQLGKI